MRTYKITPDYTTLAYRIIVLASVMIIRHSVLYAFDEKAVIEPNWERLAASIRQAEGNSNYGILKHYKHTSYKQACINTCKHAYRDYIAQGGHPPRNRANSEIRPYLAYLANRYAPRHVQNDPHDLNRYWLGNVTKAYERG